jgi:hypothetical protein
MAGTQSLKYKFRCQPLLIGVFFNEYMLLFSDMFLKNINISYELFLKFGRETHSCLFTFSTFVDRRIYLYMSFA